MSDAKLEVFDAYIDKARGYLIDWLLRESEYLIAISKGRRATGHYLYGQDELYEFDESRLKLEAAIELGDALNYVARLLELEHQNEGPPQRHLHSA